MRDTEPDGGVILLADDWMVVPGRWWTVNIYGFCRWVGSVPLLRMRVFHVLTECIFGVGKNLDHAFSVNILWQARCCTSACCCRGLGSCTQEVFLRLGLDAILLRETQQDEQ